MAASWGKNVKSAIGGVLFGVVLFFGAFPALFLNEGNYASREADLNQAKKEVQDIDAATVDPSNDGQLVHANAKAETTATLSDSEFGIAENAIHLKRNVEMYQWRETVKDEKRGTDEKEKTVKVYEYDQIWSSSPQQLTPSEAGNRTNPSFPSFAGSRSSTADEVTFGAYTLPSSLVSQIENFESVTPDLADASDAVKDAFVVSGNYYYRKQNRPTPDADPGTPPETGDPGKPAEDPTDSGDPADPGNDDDGTNSGDPTNGTSGDPTNSGDPSCDDADASEPTVEPDSGTDPDSATEPETTDDSAETTPGPTPQNVDTSNAELGDVRVSFKVARPTEVSILSRQTGTTFEPWKGKAGTSIDVLTVGTHSSEAMLEALAAAALFFVWLVRILGTLAMAVGIFSMLYPLQALANILPFLGRMVGAAIGVFSIVVALGLSIMTISVAWLFYRPLYGILLLVAGLALVACGVFIINWFRGGKKNDEPQLKNA